MSRLFCATYTDEDDTLAAVRRVRAAGHDIEDVYTPWAVHGMDQAMGLPRSRLTFVCFGAGLVGLVLAMWFQFWTSATNWPIDVGGKPWDSTPAFVPIAFEVTILFAGLGVVAALLFRCRLFPGKKAAMPSDRVTDDRFVVVARLARGADENALLALMKSSGAESVEERIGEVSA